jgi:hypothetical protein
MFSWSDVKEEWRRKHCRASRRIDSMTRDWKIAKKQKTSICTALPTHLDIYGQHMDTNYVNIDIEFRDGSRHTYMFEDSKRKTIVHLNYAVNRCIHSMYIHKGNNGRIEENHLMFHEELNEIHHRFNENQNGRFAADQNGLFDNVNGQFDDQNGQFADQMAMFAVDRNGRVIDQNGHFIGQNGRFTDQMARLIDQNGQIAFQNGQFVGQNGRFADQMARLAVDQDGQFVAQNGRFIEDVNGGVDEAPTVQLFNIGLMQPMHLWFENDAQSRCFHSGVNNRSFSSIWGSPRYVHPQRLLTVITTINALKRDFEAIERNALPEPPLQESIGALGCDVIIQLIAMMLHLYMPWIYMYMAMMAF